MAQIIYKTSDGKRVPSVTTINKIGQDSGGLIHWAWQLGVDGVDYRAAREEAADAGTVGHVLVEAAIRNEAPDLGKFSEASQASGTIAFGAFQEWYHQTKLSLVQSEVAMVSDKWRYGGKCDAIAKDLQGRFCVCDWKSGSLYPDHLCQVAAYGELWNENNPAQKISGGFHLCRFNRETGDFQHAYFGDLSEAWAAFRLKRELYDLLAHLRKRV